MAIDGARIQRVTKEGLFYLDENGEEAFIDFQACYERRLAEFMQPDTQRRKKWKDVADRNSIGGEPMGSAPYIEFYTDPPKRFVFETKEKFDEIESSIGFFSAMPSDSATEEQWEAYFATATGWTTYDRS